MVHAVEPGASAHAPAMLSGLTLAGTALIAAATVTGAWLAFRRPGHREIWFAAAAGALLIIAGCTCSPTHGPAPAPRGSGHPWCR